MVKKNEKKWYTSKTLWINALAIIGGVATALSVDISTGATLTVAGVINAILRVVSKTELK